MDSCFSSYEKAIWNLRDRIYYYPHFTNVDDILLYFKTYIGDEKWYRLLIKAKNNAFKTIIEHRVNAA